MQTWQAKRKLTSQFFGWQHSGERDDALAWEISTWYHGLWQHGRKTEASRGHPYSGYEPSPLVFGHHVQVVPALMGANDIKSDMNEE